MRGPVRWVMVPLVRAFASARRINPQNVPMPRDAPKVHAPGPDLQRVLLIGGEMSVGWGVVTHELALAGALARALTARTGRGTEVDAYVGPTMGPRATTAGLKRLDLLTYAAIVVTLGTHRAYRLASPRAWRRDLRRVLAQLELSAPNAVALLTGIPPLRSTNASDDVIDALANRHARHLNRITEKLCADEGGTVFLPLVASPSNTRVTDWKAAAYTELAAVIADRLVAEMSEGGAADSGSS